MSLSTLTTSSVSYALEPARNQFIRVLKTLFDVMNKVEGTKVPPEGDWLNDAQRLTMKSFAHLVSMEKLSHKSKIGILEDLKDFYIDAGSIYILARAVLEGFLTFNYVFINDDKANSLERHKAWKASGLKRRQSFDAIIPENQQKQLREKELIDQIHAELNADPNFSAKTKRMREKILGNDWKGFNHWSDLADAAGLGSWFSLTYVLFSEYSHSGYISALQTAGMEWKSREEGAALALRICTSVMAHHIRDYCTIFPTAKTWLDQNIEARNFLEQFLDAKRN